MTRKTFTIIFVVIIFLILVYIWIRPENDQITGAIGTTSNPPTLLCHLPDIQSGYPATGNDTSQILQYSGFHLAYNETYEQPSWVAYILTADMVINGVVERTDDFRSDTNVVTMSSSTNDYRGSGFDRGHLAPAGDMQWSAQAMSESFLMSNMSPQAPRFNRQMWRYLEAQVRDWAVKNDSLYVITGPVLNEVDSMIGENGVGVPKYFFKVILDISYPTYKGIAFFMENKELDGEITDYAISIDSLEALTGFDYFPAQDKLSMDWIESHLALSEWR